MMGLARRAGLEQVWEKVSEGERLNGDDALALLASRDLLAVGALADVARERAVGSDVYFICNRHINHTNVCRNRCLFCAFSHDHGDADAFTLSIDEVLQKARESLTGGVTEIHIVGGENPGLPYSYYLEMLRGLKELAPAVHIQAFTASEIVYLAGLAEKPVDEVLVELKEAGLGSLPGGGAEIFAGRVRDLVCNRKISGEQWLDVMRAAHRVGPQIQRYHAVRPRRDACGGRGPPAAPARPAGRDRWLQRLHPAVVPAGQHAARASCPGPPATTTC